MLKLLDGPVAGVFLVKRAPMFLRAVIDDRTNEKDVLDQIDGEPIDTKALRNNDTWRAWVMAQGKKRGLAVNPINGAIQGPALGKV
jgi:hypothetical protein